MCRPNSPPTWLCFSGLKNSRRTWSSNLFSFTQVWRWFLHLYLEIRLKVVSQEVLYFLPLPILDDERGVDRQSLYQELFDVLVELFPSPTLAIGCRKNEREALAMSSFPSSITHTTKCTTVVDLLDLFHAAASCASLNEYFGCYYSSSCRFLGTDATENWNIPEFYGY